MLPFIAGGHRARQHHRFLWVLFISLSDYKTAIFHNSLKKAKNWTAINTIVEQRELIV